MVLLMARDVVMVNGRPGSGKCVRVGCTSLGSFSASFTALVGESPSAYRARDHRAAAAIPGCVLSRLGQPGRFREAAAARVS
jgi:hypothetical protein